MSLDSVKKISIGNERNVTKGDIIREADEIWHEAQQIWDGIKPLKSAKRGAPTTQISASDYELLDKVYEQIRAKHKDFATSYPTVLRHMIQEKWYDKTAFRKYMDIVEKSPWTNDAERMDSYTKYAELLLRETNKDKHLNLTVIAAFRRDYRERLQKEHDTFIKNYESLKARVEADAKYADELKRKDLMDAFKRISVSAGVDDKRREDVENLVSSGMLKTSQLESMVYDLRRVVAGTSVEEIRREYDDHRRALVEKATSTTIQLPENMDVLSAQKIKELATTVTQKELEGKTD